MSLFLSMLYSLKNKGLRIHTVCNEIIFDHF